MKANKILVSLLTLVLTLALMFSLFSVSVFAEDAGSSTTGSSNSTTTEEHDDHDGHDHGSEKKEENNIVETIVSLSIVRVVLIAVAVYCIVKREKVGKFFRAIKSEMKKIVWFSWKDTRKSSIVVIVAVIIIALVIGVLDFAFNNGIKLLYNLFN
jgi:preprotein translocase subunit SecE